MIKAGVIGWPIEHSKSPIIHGHWLEKHGIEGSYEKISLSPEEFENGVGQLVENGFAGANVTVPHKEAALEISDIATDRAKNAGAANTLFFHDGLITADNTDGLGFINNVMSGAPDWNAGSGPALVLGAGGAARGIIHSLLDVGVPQIILSNRTRSRAETLAGDFGHKVMVCDFQDAVDAAKNVSILINTTALGMVGQPPLNFDCSGLDVRTLVTDIVYNPLQTQLLKDAQSHGCKVVDGLGMLLHQAVPGFEGWFGTRPNVDAELRAKIEATL